MFTSFLLLLTLDLIPPTIKSIEIVPLAKAWSYRVIPTVSDNVGVVSTTCIVNDQDTDCTFTMQNSGFYVIVIVAKDAVGNTARFVMEMRR